MGRIKDINVNTPKYWDNFANEAYMNADERRGGNFCKFSTVKDLISENLNILDVGCLNGNFYNFLKKNSFSTKSFTGVDHSKKLIEIAHKRFPEQSWISSDCYKLPFSDNSFDVITGMEILEHLEEPKKALLEMKRVCKQNGIIIITVPNEERIKDVSHIWSFSSVDIFNFLHEISKNVQVLLTCSNDRNIVGKAVIDFKSYF